MSLRRRRQRADEEHDLELVDFLSEAEDATPTMPSRPWPPAGAEIVTHGGGGDTPVMLSIADDDFPSEECLSHGSAMTADIAPVHAAAARPAPPPNAMRRVITFSVYAMAAIAGAAVGWFAGDFTRTLAPEANNAALVTSASPEWVPFATPRQPVRGGSIRPAAAAPEEIVEPRARVGGHATPPPEGPRAAAGAVTGGAASPGRVAPPRVAVPPVSAPAASAETAPNAPPTVSTAAPRSGAAVAVAASTPELSKPGLPLSEPSRTASAPTETPRAEAPRTEAPRADASSPELPRTEAARRRETGLIETVLDRYVGAFNALDAEAARAVWPGVDARALARVFTQLEEQELTFEECRVELDEARATAVCRGVARYVPKVGSRSSRSTPRQWTFRLQKVEDHWTIDGVNIR